MRQLGSKLIAGGLSAGVVLLWWPLFFPTDSVTTWLCRGIVWTLSFELLLLALSPFEHALWSTRRGERLVRRVEAGRALLDHESPKRRLGRRAGLALGALAVPLALIAVGVSSHIPAAHGTPTRVTRVTRVVRVVKPVRVVRPVRVQRVVRIQTIAQALPAVSPSPPPSTSDHPTAKARRTAGRPKPLSATPKPSPTAHATPVPMPQRQATQPTGTSDSSGTAPQPSAGQTAPAPGAQS